MQLWFLSASYFAAALVIASIPPVYIYDPIEAAAHNATSAPIEARTSEVTSLAKQRIYLLFMVPSLIALQMVLVYVMYHRHVSAAVAALKRCAAHSGILTGEVIRVIDARPETGLTLGASLRHSFAVSATSDSGTPGVTEGSPSGGGLNASVFERPAWQLDIPLCTDVCLITIGARRIIERAEELHHFLEKIARDKVIADEVERMQQLDALGRSAVTGSSFRFGTPPPSALRRPNTAFRSRSANSVVRVSVPLEANLSPKKAPPAVPRGAPPAEVRRHVRRESIQQWLGEQQQRALPDASPVPKEQQFRRKARAVEEEKQPSHEPFCCEVALSDPDSDNADDDPAEQSPASRRSRTQPRRIG